MLDVISVWRWYQAVLLLPITSFKRQGLKAMQANAAHTQLYKQGLRRVVMRVQGPLCEDTGHFTLVQFHDVLPKVYNVS